MPSWTLQLWVSRWVAPSSFAATVTGQTAGLTVRSGLPVTLLLDRRTRCIALDKAGVARVIGCASVRPKLAQRGQLTAQAGAQSKMGHLGAVGLRARALTLRCSPARDRGSESYRGRCGPGPYTFYAG